MVVTDRIWTGQELWRVSVWTMVWTIFVSDTQRVFGVFFKCQVKMLLVPIKPKK